MAGKTGKMGVEVRDRALVLTYEVSAPPALVFEAYSKAEHLMQWFGPREWPLAVCEVDFRPGGQWHYCMRGPAGEESWGLATYREIVEPSRIAYQDAFSDAQRSIIPPLAEVTVEFTESRPGRTLITTESVYESNEQRDQVVRMGVEEGFRETLERLEEHLASLQ
jgi:uncharacterized protein YndB with AHSA1/START domain